MIPRCPRCETSDAVERTHIAAAPYFCGDCDLAYTGHPNEVAAERERRVNRCSPAPTTEVTR